MLKSFTVRQNTHKIVSIYGAGSGVVFVDDSNKRTFFDLFKRREITVESMNRIVSHNENNGDIILAQRDEKKQIGHLKHTEQNHENGKPVRLLLEGIAGTRYIYSLFSDHKLRFTDMSDYSSIVFEMPVNVLNFSNILVIPAIKNGSNSCFKVITVSTTDPDCFDVYFVDIVSGTLDRLLKLVKPMQETRNLGNIMQFSYIKHNNSIAVGYEDGSVVLFSLNEPWDKVAKTTFLVNFPAEYIKASEDESECDHPVLYFEYSETDRKLFMGHAKSNCIFVYEFETEVLRSLKLNNVFSVSAICRFSSDILVFSTWETGSVYKISTSSDTPIIETVYTIPEKPNIQLVDIDPSGDTTVAHPFKEASREYNKITCLKTVAKEELQQSYLEQPSKVLLKRYSQLISCNHVIVGLESGAVTILQL